MAETNAKASGTFNMLPIPGTGKVRHLEENTAAAGPRLSDEDFRALDAQGREAWKKSQQK